MSVSNEYYKVFYYVARYKSFSKAAKALLSSQPNITRIIGNLESELGCKLFERTNQGAVLTPAGENLYKYAEAAQKALEVGETMVRRFKDQPIKGVSIGISAGISDSRISLGILPGINAFASANPDVHLQMISGSTPELIEMIGEGALNLAIVNTLKRDKLPLTGYTISCYKDIIVAGNKFRPIFEGKTVSLSDIFDYPTISLMQGSETFTVHSNLLANIGMTFNPTIEVPSIMHAKVFAENNLGIACIDSDYALPSIREGKLFEIKVNPVFPERTVSLIKNEKEKNTAADALEASIISEVESAKKELTDCGL